MPAAFYNQVRGDIWTILSQQYDYRGSGEALARERPFWQDMRFHEVSTVDGSNGNHISITFTPIDQPTTIYGYKIDLDKAAAAWNERVGIRDARQNPTMFAVELVWYMVVYIGETNLERCRESGKGVCWINAGTDAFLSLPLNDAALKL